MSYTIEEVLEIAKKSKFILFSININGEIVNFITLDSIPETYEMYKLIKLPEHKGTSVSVMKIHKNISHIDIQKKIESSVEALKYGQNNKLKSGINIPKDK